MFSFMEQILLLQGHLKFLILLLSQSSNVWQANIITIMICVKTQATKMVAQFF
jgi:hypothetical protein